MSKLWIVHRNPQRRASLARIAGLEARDFHTGAPLEAEFAEASAPAAVLVGVEGDFELELELAHRLRTRLPDASWILLAAPEDAEEARRLFDLVEPEILEPLPSARVLRAAIASAMARRTAESLAERRNRSRVAQRFSAWLGGVEVPGLLRALDPSLANLPLLVRGVPGSGRALLGHYVELFRGGGGPTIRVHGSDIANAEDLARRIAHRRGPRERARFTVWIDEIDRLPISAQAALAEWIQHGTSPGSRSGEAPRWIATAGPARWQDALEPGLHRAFAPFEIEVPSLAEHPETVAPFAEEVARDWALSVGGTPRRLAPSAIAALQERAWEGDRAEVEAVLRATLAVSAANPIEAQHLCLEPVHATPTEASTASDTATVLSSEPTDSLVHEPDELDLPDAIVAEIEPAETLAAAELEGPQGVEVEPELEADVEALGETDADDSLLLSEASFALAEAAEQDTRAEPPVPTSAPRATDAADSAARAASGNGWRRLARSLSHEIRNPLVSIRTFAELLPDHYDDETFRQRFVELVGQDVAHIGDVLSRLSSVAEQEKLESRAFDVSEMMETLLEERRERIQARRLLVLRELERDAPLALADPTALRAALAGLLDRALASLPERGDLFVATRYIGRSTEGASRLRILLRHHSPELAGDADAPLEELSPAANVLEYVLAQAVVEATGGSLTIDSTDAQETLILVDLRTPS